MAWPFSLSSAEAVAWNSSASISENGYKHVVPKKFEVVGEKNLLPHIRWNFIKH